jgi:hypothetical protein
MVYRRLSCLGNTITVYLFLVTKAFFLNRETKKLTSLSSAILMASIRNSRMRLHAPKRSNILQLSNGFNSRLMSSAKFIKIPHKKVV